MVELDVEEIMKRLYGRYASDTDYLFGISPLNKDAVRAIIKFTIEELRAGV